MRRGEAVLTPTGALNAVTGKYTGRSPRDKFIVDEPSVHPHIAWGNINQPISSENFDRLYRKIRSYMQEREVFQFDGYAGADPDHRLAIRVVSEYAWHNLFVRQLFVRPQPDEQVGEPEFTVICMPGVVADPDTDGTSSEAFIVTSFERRLIIIGGSRYAGEMKKSVFGVLNYLLPMNGVLPMHCSANAGPAGDVALFFGLSGTGKTTLSADPSRQLIGDDEHGWSDKGIFNFEGGCYAKCIRLSHEHEPQIWDAIRFGTVLENVVVDPVSHEVDFNSDALTENTRAAYPLTYIPGARLPSVAGHPKVIMFLTADATGVLPPISRLNENQAMYHFLSGYTSKLAGTERGVSGVQSTFSTCFGSPFLPLPPVVYADLLGKMLRQHDTAVFLVNTGWTGGGLGAGQRIPLSHTRSLVSAALSGQLDKVEYRTDPVFGLHVPTECPGVPAHLLNPRGTWADPTAYDRAARELADRFIANFKNFPGATPPMLAAGPRVL